LGNSLSAVSVSITLGSTFLRRLTNSTGGKGPAIDDHSIWFHSGRLTKTISIPFNSISSEDRETENGYIKEVAMNNIDDILQAIFIGLVVATFLLNTGRALKAIEICKECLMPLNNKVLKMEREIFNSLHIGIYKTSFRAYCLIPDHTKALIYGRKLLDIYRKRGKTDEEGNHMVKLADIYTQQHKYLEARELYEKAINIPKEKGDRRNEANTYEKIGIISYYLSDYDKAKENFNKALAIRLQTGDKNGQAADYGNLGTVLESLGQYDKAKEYLEKALAIKTQICDKEGEGTLYGNLGTVLLSLSEYGKAKEYLDEALSINIRIGDKEGEAGSYGKLGIVFQALGQYDKAKEYHEKSLATTIQIGDKKGEARSYVNLGTVFLSLGQYHKAKQYLEKALAITIQIGDKDGEASSYGNLGTVFTSLGQYEKAKEYLEKALAIKIQNGDKNRQATTYGNLGTVFLSLSEYGKAKKYIEKALAIKIQIGDKLGEASSYGNLGTLFASLGQYDNAKEYHEKALAIKIQIGDKNGEASSYENLGTVFKSLGQYKKAKEYHEKALAITIQIGNKYGEASSYGNLGTVFESLGQYDKAKEYLERALAIRIQIGDKEGEASSYENLGAVFTSLRQYDKAKENLEKALAIRIQIGNKSGEAISYGNLGTVSISLGQYDNAKEFLEKALAIRMQIGDKEGEAADHANLGALYGLVGEYVMAEDYIEKALSITRDIEDLDKEFNILCVLTVVKLFQYKIQEAFDCLFLSMNKSESLRSFLGENDDFKVSSLDVRNFPYQILSAFFCFWGNPNHALYVLELARARALADLMATQYSVESHISADPQSWIGIENIMKKESNSSCVYISYRDHNLFFWVLKTSGIIHFRRITVDEKLIDARLIGKLDNFLAKSFRGFGILPEEDCEDRSLNEVQSLAALRLIEEEDEESGNSESSFSLYYRMLISPVVDLLEELELIVVPDRCLNQVPFPALKDEAGRYLSEKYRIRIVPSLTTLKLIRDSPSYYHSQTGALIVGDPAVGMVRYKREEMPFSRLPCALNEAVMIGRLLGVQPLLGQHATKQAVLDRLHSVSLIHFAAHGNADRGEIALSPVRRPNRIPEEEDYLLTMSDIANVQLRAKLVVLSCCHSACGQIRAEGVVGIARAFLGSGARSVLVALWAISDKATEQLMCRFYEHLVRGESASESLHQAMKWMRANGFDMVCEWAPFLLIGDNVTFDFGK